MVLRGLHNEGVPTPIAFSVFARGGPLERCMWVRVRECLSYSVGVPPLCACVTFYYSCNHPEN